MPAAHVCQSDSVGDSVLAHADVAKRVTGAALSLSLRLQPLWNP